MDYSRTVKKTSTSHQKCCFLALWWSIGTVLADNPLLNCRIEGGKKSYSYNL